MVYILFTKSILFIWEYKKSFSFPKRERYRILSSYNSTHTGRCLQRRKAINKDTGKTKDNHSRTLSFCQLQYPIKQIWNRTIPIWSAIFFLELTNFLLGKLTFSSYLTFSFISFILLVLNHFYKFLKSIYTVCCLIPTF